ncbi:MAG TPA: aldo/keto reductase [Solirubrobacterales bacterium]|nr:aldo/keto reductase [Solirubrobacterales bacterium]
MLPAPQHLEGETALFDRCGEGTRLGFGCAGLMRTPSRRSRQRLLGEAFEQGIRHFDVARMYGLGVAEEELGRFARGRREQITIATKFGIEPSRSASRLARLQAPARAAVARFPALRAALKRREGAFHVARRYDGDAARMSLKTSLEALGTDYVDVLFVHDPGATDLTDAEELVGTLEELRRDGRLRAWGVSGEFEPSAQLRDAVDAPLVFQVRDDMFDPAPIGPEADAITFGVLSRAVSRILERLGASGERRSRWSRIVGEDCGRPEVVASLLLQDALERNAGGGVLFSTTRPERVKAAVAAAERVSSGAGTAALRGFRECMRVEFGEMGGSDRG